ncbi:TRAP transporter substrate-binding protein DctP [Thermodesulfobacteriota bacterium]
MLRRFRLVLVSMVLSFVLLSGPASAVTLRLATLATEGMSWMKTFNRMNDEVIEKTGGQVKFKVYPGGVQGSDADVLRKVRSGLLNGGTFTAGGASEILRDLQIPSLPFLFRGYDEVDYVMERLGPRFEAELAEQGFVVLAWLETGFAYMMSQKPIASLEDLKGRNVWIPEGDPISRCIFETAGVPPIQLSLPDVLTALQSGLLDTVANSAVGTIVLQWHTKVGHLTDKPLIYAFGVLMVDAKTFGKVPKQYQPLVKETVARYFKGIKAQIRKDNAEAMDTLRGEGIKFISLTDEHARELLVLAEKVKSKLVGKVYSAETLALLESYLAEYRKAGKGAE